MFVKICGTTNEEDALLAVAMGADAVGFIFAPSPRQIAPRLAGEIARRLPPEVLTVGVFRDETPERVVELTLTAGLRAAQLHGHEPPEHTRYVKERVPVVFKAFVAGDPGARAAVEHGADAVLVDSPDPGSGRVFDWSLAEDIPARVPLVLAGGLNADNVAEAVARVHPWGVDVVSGVEAEPGRKDARALRAFVAAVRAIPADRSSHGGEDGEAARPVGFPPFDWQEHGG